MALGKCRECGHEVSKRAKSCPSCGKPHPTRTGISAKGFAIGLGVVVLLGFALGDDDKAGSADEQMEANAAPAEDAVDMAADREAEEAACREDIQCWGDEHVFTAAVACEPIIERMAEYTMEWTDGWTEPKFGYFRWKDQDAGVVTFMGDKARFQNGFGAWSNVTYECDYDPTNEAVLDIRIE